ncbi:MAG: hypothetical protein AUJ52_15305 [Elusimicrobia bacterium CG1_02_63_36]|nr:MAG: hypothetical protein AUJ52_15305 [Elusimicrobia bacterium CG1_02_63_36]PIP82496.1 MAG: hypothetical protein COR54_14590 [Elusimicrobia bacterium CG22_combo_CG10-13_8_21_14_all_63_91]PJA14632.1 MAG: hypothetical protein COX66_12050 [Elusimicrobia bacterium CG_4_10_14_0_2_um_filter_63_34]PJB26143.1 MAG: hypothetical protein CO113_04830 [Elusimicrobia bacterium CG_4_9_14_3_um_filter_62_55]
MKAFIAILIFACAGAFAQETVVETHQETIQEGADHEVVKADTLWDLSEYFYHTPWLWPRIYEANTDRIKDPNVIYPGQVFVIPGLGKTVMVTDQEVKKPVRTPEPEPEPVVELAPKAPPGELADSDSLSTEFPKGMTGQTAAMPRFKMAKGWTPDGRVLDYQGKESMTASGDLVRVQISNAVSVRRRTRLAVYRWSALREDDPDPKGIYVQRVGEIEVVRKIKDGEYRAMVVKSGGSIQLNDILKAE